MTGEGLGLDKRSSREYHIPMIPENIVLDKAKLFEDKLTKTPMIKITVREGAKLFGCSIQTMHNYFWLWQEKGWMLYVPINDKQGNWFWLGVDE